MEKKYIYYPFMALAMTVALSSCDDFLDEMPDNRTELDTEAKITSMLVSAYPETNYALLAEMSSDNADDNGGTWTAYNKLQEEAATWKDATYKEEDSPYSLWNDCYKAIAAANAALDAINTTRHLWILRGEKHCYAVPTTTLFWSIFLVRRIVRKPALRI